ncbi:flavin reductase family protein [Arsenicicoccus dermatophilus]|uniref:flavin reductase family protein n=1 Tax=Arsenicicoccus dermatophilus TaxID=1076331 RepID=UPI001F4CB741|nr:flavin reductase family protein [Arsenicicoccus dermatophilus]MCH8611789.1 flavin reductase family protein [Arsenicicoccus dermatophilus]
MRIDYPAAGDQGLPPAAMYRLLTSVVVPRPIAWVTTRSAAGVDNLAPHSFYTVSCVRPPMVQFTSVGVKDTLRNVQQTGEFVIHLLGERHVEVGNATGTDYPPEVSELDALGLTREPAATVSVPRLAESPVAIECRLHQELTLGDSTVVIGAVTHVAVDAAVLDRTDPEAPHARIRDLAPVARLGRDEWSTIGEVTERARIPWSVIRPT